MSEAVPYKPQSEFTIEDLKPHSESCPLTIFQVQDNNAEFHLAILETFSPGYQEAYNFLICIAEPITRPNYVHEYEVTMATIRPALSLGYSTDEIERQLYRHSKYKYLPNTIRDILASLRNNESSISMSIFDADHYIFRFPTGFDFESLPLTTSGPDADLLECSVQQQESDNMFERVVSEQRRLQHPEKEDAAPRLRINKNDMQCERKLVLLRNVSKVRQCLVDNKKSTTEEFFLALTPNHRIANIPPGVAKYFNDDSSLNISSVKKLLGSNDWLHGPKGTELTTLVRFLQDTHHHHAPSINAALKPTTEPRDYQSHATKKVVSDIRELRIKKCNSGLIILPCGAGKSLLGISCVCALGFSVIVVTNGNLSSKQWENQFLQFSSIDKKQIYIFSSDNADSRPFIPGFHTVFISTYQMLTNEKPSKKSEAIKHAAMSVLWGIVLFDEAHQLFASTYKTLFCTNIRESGTTNFLRSYSKIGLTATPLREDDEMARTLHHLGGRLYESNWSDLSKRGFIASLQCSEILCPMTLEFYSRLKLCDRRAHLSKEDLLGSNRTAKGAGQQEPVTRTANKIKQNLGILNPRKLETVWHLKEFHCARGDQILIFCDYLDAAKLYSQKLNIPFIIGDCPESERECLINAFSSRKLNCLLLSSVGDTSLDLPEANVLIEIGWNEGSRKQETQRIGRISRPKSGDSNAYFYILVSDDTPEVRSAAKRREYLNYNQGYPYAVIDCDEIIQQCQKELRLQGTDKRLSLPFSDPRGEREYFREVATAMFASKDEP